MEMKKRNTRSWLRQIEGGATLESLGRENGITRERVRQILEAREGAPAVETAKKKAWQAKEKARYTKALHIEKERKRKASQPGGRVPKLTAKQKHVVTKAAAEHPRSELARLHKQLREIRREQRKIYSDQDIQRMVRMRKQKKSWREIGEVFGRTAAGICGVVNHRTKRDPKAFGELKRRMTPAQIRQREQTIQRIDKLRKKGLSWKAIGKALHKSESYVYGIALRWN